MQPLELQKELIEYLSGFITPDRLDRIESVLQQRTRHITVILEDIYQTQNGSGVLRTCDAFGIQDVHIVQNKIYFQIHREITLGSDKWLTLHYYKEKGVNNTKRCLQELKRQGYKIVATTPHQTNVTLEQLPVNEKLAFMFGSEIDGLSDHALECADLSVSIPMVGFSQSLNIGVSAAVCLYEAIARLRNQENHWVLCEEEKLALKLSWLRHSIRSSDRLEQKFFEEKDC